MARGIIPLIVRPCATQQILLSARVAEERATSRINVRPSTRTLRARVKVRVSSHSLGEKEDLEKHLEKDKVAGAKERAKEKAEAKEDCMEWNPPLIGCGMVMTTIGDSHTEMEA